MPKTTFILITVLFGVICGNRLMDNRLLRSSSTTLYSPSYKSLNDDTNNIDSFNDNIEEDLKLKSVDKSEKQIDLPCSNNLDFDRDLMSRKCNDNFGNLLKNPTNYLAYDNNDDLMHNTNAIKSYQNIPELNDIFGVEPFMPPKNSKNEEIISTNLNIFPEANYKDFYNDLVVETNKEEMTKRNGNSPARGCDCKIKNDVLDLGQHHFPRYLLHAICHSEHSRNELGPKCWSGSICRPLEYKVNVLTFRTLRDNMQRDPSLALLPDNLRQIWKFKTVTVAAGCFCS
ncbi:uncharacterized protein LOC111674781 [Lucilia cuprina]|uniref:uncharacterized protein LOC111674781 n=1 Tax=Lucilia cuprina TaxID=7375 RepID=UPI001F054378|nr:uncharacterized protein LOC111674781 [Lucilia cuprina]